MSNNSAFMDIIKIVSKLADDRIVYKNIKENPEERAKYVRFGVTAIIYSVMTAVFAVGGAFMLYGAFSGNWKVFATIFGAIAGFILILGSIITFIFATSHTVKQLILNKRAISWIALAVFILCVGAIVFTLSMIFNGL